MMDKNRARTKVLDIELSKNVRSWMRTGEPTFYSMACGENVNLPRNYAVTTRRLNKQVRRNKRRFPADFGFYVTKIESDSLKSQIATSSSAAWGGRRKPAYVFTEHGAIMAASVLNS